MQLQDLTFEKLIGAAAVILLMIGIYNTIMTAIKNHREEKKRKSEPVRKIKESAGKTREMVEKHEKMLRADRKRIATLEDEQRIMLRSQMAMLSHEINGNSIDKLKKSVAEIQDYLIDK